MRVLVVEDEKKLAGFIRKGLEEHAFAVTVSHNGDDAHALLRAEPFDLLVLDIMLPGRDGLSILKSLRDGKNTVPVILVTARAEKNERVEGLNLGADDYIAKPFYIDELIARVQAVLRRTSGEQLSVLRAGDLSVNLITREVRRGRDEIMLPPREFSLLEYLMRSPGRVFTRSQILEHVWGYSFDPGTNLVDVCIQRLRSQIDSSGSDSLIEAVRGVGYRFRKLEEAV
ncbi:MAG: response regulator transcription factor [Lentisphaerae bacterium]|nr:response regulator transcription factor [Lentisphaerota bacterium]